MQRRQGFSVRFWPIWLVLQFGLDPDAKNHHRRSVSERFPFIHATSVIILPPLYWFLTLGLGLLPTQDNRGWGVSFGQVTPLHPNSPRR